MLLLSIDVGIRNLGVCLMDHETKKIKQWDATGIPPQHSSGLYVCLRDHMRSRPWVLEASHVLIEKQPDKNKTMKSVENFLHAYFICNDKSVQIYDARHKIPDVSGPGRSMYIKRKKASVERCGEFLKDTNQIELYNWFSKQKKKDDLADTVMQALSYSPSSSSSAAETKKSKPRKPTPNQIDTKYSKANLAWVYLHGKRDARFEKDLNRYYRDVSEMLSEFNINNT